MCYQIPNSPQAVSLTDSSTSLDSKPTTLNDLSPGKYIVFFQTVPEGDPNKPYSSEVDPGRFRDSREFELKPGQTKNVTFQFRPLDRERLSRQPDSDPSGRNA